MQNSISTTDREVLEKERARENNISEARGYRGLILATTPQGHREWYSAYEKQVGAHHSTEVSSAGRQASVRTTFVIYQVHSRTHPTHTNSERDTSTQGR